MPWSSSGQRGREKASSQRSYRVSAGAGLFVCWWGKKQKQVTLQVTDLLHSIPFSLRKEIANRASPEFDRSIQTSIRQFVILSFLVAPRAFLDFTSTPPQTFPYLNNTFPPPFNLSTFSYTHKDPTLSFYQLPIKLPIQT